ncbi:hypothetical protein KIW84_040799 [Lathyrus oleraceus]|uniref:Uncharacterized protein n=1 Tax=Pisum sativum TaxID=3888 RepID=A0A9D4XB24_PEA|nr:hypothetical protein KIW84_040799 [Pisum sativum]
MPDDPEVTSLGSPGEEINGYEEPIKKSKSMALKSIWRSEKSSQTWEQKEATQDESSDEDFDDDKMEFIIKTFQYLSSKNRRFSSKKYGFKGTSSIENKDDQKGCFNFQKPDHFIDGCLDLQKDKTKKKNFQKNNFRSKFNQSPMATWDEFDDKEEADKIKEEDNLALVASTF